ncbi:MAG: KOW motif-containing protein, partial [Selenomonas sp.]|nr:KOW motif-containing protein [Selenomonas sp.]
LTLRVINDISYLDLHTDLCSRCNLFIYLIENIPVDIEKVKTDADFAVGDAVRITSGSFENFMAKVSAVDAEKNRVTVLAEMFGGDETPVELGFDEIEKI